MLIHTVGIGADENPFVRLFIILAGRYRTRKPLISFRNRGTPTQTRRQNGGALDFIESQFRNRTVAEKKSSKIQFFVGILRCTEKSDSVVRKRALLPHKTRNYRHVFAFTRMNEFFFLVDWVFTALDSDVRAGPHSTGQSIMAAVMGLITIFRPGAHNCPLREFRWARCSLHNSFFFLPSESVYR